METNYANLTEAQKEELAVAYSNGKLEVKGFSGEWRPASVAKFKRPSLRNSKAQALYPFKDDMFYRVAS